MRIIGRRLGVVGNLIGGWGRGVSRSRVRFEGHRLGHRPDGHPVAIMIGTITILLMILRQRVVGEDLGRGRIIGENVRSKN